LVQSLNAVFLMLKTLPGTVIPVRLLHPSNALIPMSATPSGMVIDFKPVHSLNAFAPTILVSLWIV